MCQQLSVFTSTTMARSVARRGGIPIGKSREESQKLLNQTTAAVDFPHQLDFSAVEDISEIVRSSVAGLLVSVRELCAVKRTLKSATDLLAKLKEVSSGEDNLERYSPLLEILWNCNVLTSLEQKIGFCIDCSLSIILDRASDELEIIRLERKTNMENLESLLKTISNQIFQSGGIDKPLTTKRRSRMCIAIRAAYRYLLPDGIVLQTSSSGATYFMEPKQAVELNNKEVQLLNSEKAEEKAILSLLTSEIAESAKDIIDLLDKITELDLAFARANYARWINGACPLLNIERRDDDLLVDIEGIKHPLLLGSSLSKNSFQLDNGNGLESSDVSSQVDSNFPVPIDIKIGSGKKVVVISGPNTGGKTASMKTLGLASVMSKAGMYLPAQNSPQIPWFDLVLADIGDHQSLEQSLSTFSGHISRICNILEAASQESLVLIDEIGSGTDPSEGVALSTSILHYLKDRVNLAVVTTHYADLSLLKEKDTRFENAAMEFSLLTLQPTYRILWGSSGDSNALSIAESIGFDKKIIEGAEKWVERLTPEKQQERKGLLYRSLMEERERLQIQARKAESLHSEIMEIYHEIKDEAQDLEERERALKERETQRVNRAIRAAKSQFETIIKEFDDHSIIESPEQLNLLIKRAESEIAFIVEDHCPSDDFSVREKESSYFYSPRLGEQVFVKGLGHKLATVVEAPGGDEPVLVQYGKIKVRVNKSTIKPITKSGRNAETRGEPSSKVQRQVRRMKKSSEANQNEDGPYGPLVQTSKNMVDLRGMRVEEASHYLNMAISSRGSHSVLFVIHGMGTGVVKECAIELLRNHPRVAKFEQESPLNYGCTVAYIK